MVLLKSFKKFSHAVDDTSNPFLPGMSSTGVAISEKHSDIKFDGESRIGIPFNILMRDILQFDNTLDDALR